MHQLQRVPHLPISHPGSPPDPQQYSNRVINSILCIIRILLDLVHLYPCALSFQYSFTSASGQGHQLAPPRMNRMILVSLLYIAGVPYPGTCTSSTCTAGLSCRFPHTPGLRVRLYVYRPVQYVPFILSVADRGPICQLQEEGRTRENGQNSKSGHRRQNSGELDSPVN